MIDAADGATALAVLNAPVGTAGNAASTGLPGTTESYPAASINAGHGRWVSVGEFPDHVGEQDGRDGRDHAMPGRGSGIGRFDVGPARIELINNQSV